MPGQAGTDPRPDVWVGIIAELPWILLYLRGFIAELGKFSAQALWRLVSRRGRTQSQIPTITILFVISTGGAEEDGTSSDQVDTNRLALARLDRPGEDGRVGNQTVLHW